jgi:L,D-transpeptidase ErfK/SrfK
MQFPDNFEVFMGVAYKLFAFAMALTAVSGCATASRSRSDALKQIVELRKQGVQSQFVEEYMNLETVYAVGEALLKEQDTEGAEKYFEFALMKGKLLGIKHTGRPVALAGPDLRREVPKSSAIEPKGEQSKDPALSAVAKPETQSPPQLSKAGQSRTPQGVVAPARESIAVSPVKLAEPVPAERMTVAAPTASAATATATAKASTSQLCKYMVGGETRYTVKRRDTLRLIGAKYRVSQKYLAKLNGIDAKMVLHPGQVLKIIDRHIIPKKLTDGLVINIADCTLYYFRRGELLTTIPITVGKPKAKDSVDWQTPVGDFRVVAKIKDPTWHIPTSIQKEMEEKGEEVETEIPPGPENPLGRYAIRTSIPGILIHSTTAPSSIYGFSSHGCIRVHPDQIAELFKEVRVNTKGEIIYRPVKVAVTDGGTVFLEVHSDVYDKVSSLEKEARETIRKQRLGARIDWKKVERVVREKSGFAEEVSL